MFLTSSSRLIIYKDLTIGIPRVHFEGGVCILLNIWHTYFMKNAYCYKKLTISRESPYIDVVFPKKIIIIAVDLVSLQAAWKMAKNTKNGQNSSFRARFQATHTTSTKTFDACGRKLIRSCCRKKIHGKTLKTHRVMAQEPLKTHIFTLPTSKNRSSDRPLR